MDTLIPQPPSSAAAPVDPAAPASTKVGADPLPGFAEWLSRSRAACGLPVRVEDADALARVRMLAAAACSTSR